MALATIRMSRRRIARWAPCLHSMMHSIECFLLVAAGTARYAAVLPEERRCSRGARGLAGKCRCRSANMSCAKKRSEEHTSELQSLMRISYAVFCLKKKKRKNTYQPHKLEEAHE